MNNRFEQGYAGKGSEKKGGQEQRLTPEELEKMTPLQQARYFANEINGLVDDVAPVLSSMEKLEQSGDRASLGDILKVLGDTADFAIPRVARAYDRFKAYQAHYEKGKK